MAYTAGGGGGGGSSKPAAYRSGGSTYSSQVPKAAKGNIKKAKAAYGKSSSTYRSQVPKAASRRSVPKPKAPSRPAYRPTSPAPSGPKRGGYGNNSSGVGSSSTGAVVPKVSKPVIPSDTDWLKTDSAYQSQSAALAKALQDYTAQQNQAQTGYETNYASDLNSWGTNQKQALGDLENDYASRGLLQSGLYGDALATTNNDWDQRKSQLELAKQQYLQGLASDKTNFMEQQTLTDTQAKQEAAARKAAKYGIA